MLGATGHDPVAAGSTASALTARTVLIMADTPRHIGIVVDVLGHGTISVDGCDLTHAVQGISLDVRSGTPTRVLLDLKPGAVTVDGMAVTEQAVPADMLEQLGRLLAAVDPVTLERRALEVEDLSGDAPVTRAILQVLGEMIRGG